MDNGLKIVPEGVHDLPPVRIVRKAAWKSGMKVPYLFQVVS